MKHDMYKLFVYKGPVMVDDNCINETWEAETMAVDRTDAYSRLVMKNRHSNILEIDSDSKVTLPGRLIEVKM